MFIDVNCKSSIRLSQIHNGVMNGLTESQTISKSACLKSSNFNQICKILGFMKN